jgi:hypothetical protein
MRRDCIAPAPLNALIEWKCAVRTIHRLGAVDSSAGGPLRPGHYVALRREKVFDGPVYSTGPVNAITVQLGSYSVQRRRRTRHGELGCKNSC